jgi:hypothetical protein
MQITRPLIGGSQVRALVYPARMVPVTAKPRGARAQSATGSQKSVFAANAVGNTHRNTLSPRLSGKRMLTTMARIPTLPFLGAIDKAKGRLLLRDGLRRRSVARFFVDGRVFPSQRRTGSSPRRAKASLHLGQCLTRSHLPWRACSRLTASTARLMKGNLGVYAVCLGVTPDSRDRSAVAALMCAAFPGLVRAEISRAVGIDH